MLLQITIRRPSNATVLQSWDKGSTFPAPAFTYNTDNDGGSILFCVQLCMLSCCMVVADGCADPTIS